MVDWLAAEIEHDDNRYRHNGDPNQRREQDGEPAGPRRSAMSAARRWPVRRGHGVKAGWFKPRRRVGAPTVPAAGQPSAAATV